MRLLTLPLHVRQRLIEHEEDILSPAVEARAQKYSAPCPRCGGAMHQRLAARTFTSDSVLPRTVAKCVDCDCEIDAQSGLMTATGNPAQVESPLPILDPNKE